MFSKMSKTDLIQEVKMLAEQNEAWLEKCTEMEAQLAASRKVLQPIYNRFKVEDEGCNCDLCISYRMLFEGKGGRAMIEEFREQRLAIEEALSITAALLTHESVSHGRMKKAVVWFARLAGKRVPA